MKTPWPQAPVLRPLTLLLLLAGGSACDSLIPPRMPDEPPPLAGMEEPLDLFKAPEDEAERRGMPYGGFTGVETGPAGRSMDELAEGVEGVAVTRVVENSPGDMAGLREGDLLLRVRDAAGKDRSLEWPSQWRAAELEAKPGAVLHVSFDRAGAAMEADLTVIPRVRPAGKPPMERFREEQRVGVVLRTATEVEARRHGLAPGGGAVIVGLSKDSPWRRAGLRYDDLITAVDGEPADHPQEILNAIRTAEDSLEITYWRDGEQKRLEAATSERQGGVTLCSIPLLFHYEKDRDEKEITFLLGILKHRSTAAAWEWRFLWLFYFRGGDADRLEEVENP